MGVLPNLKQPEGSYLCGAYSVVACIRLFEVDDRVVTLNKFDPSVCDFSGEVVNIDTSADDDVLAKQIYKVTGIYSPFDMDNFVEKDGFNPLFCVAYILQKLELDVRLLIKAPLDLEQLINQYPVEGEVLRKLNCPISNFDETHHAADSVLIPVVVYPLGEIMTSHYLVSHEQQWLDTELDQHPLHWDKIQDWETSQNKRSGAVWTGFALRVSRNL